MLSLVLALPQRDVVVIHGCLPLSIGSLAPVEHIWSTLSMPSANVVESDSAGAGHICCRHPSISRQDRDVIGFGMVSEMMRLWFGPNGSPFSHG